MCGRPLSAICQHGPTAVLFISRAWHVNAIHQDVRTYLHSGIHMRGLAIAAAMLALHALQCVAILKVFSQKTFADHLSSREDLQSERMSWIPISSLWACYLSWESTFLLRSTGFLGSLETSSWRLSQILSCRVWSYDLRGTPWKKVGAGWNEPSTDPHAAAEAESLTPCGCECQVRNLNQSSGRPIRLWHERVQRLTRSQTGSWRV